MFFVFVFVPVSQVQREYITGFIEGEILPGSNHVIEDQNSHTGYAMPEFPGYNGKASHECWLLKVKAVTHRRKPIIPVICRDRYKKN